MDYSKKDFVKETGITDEQLHELREAFVKKYADMKGWNTETLSSEQINEIHQQDGYKKAGLLFS